MEHKTRTATEASAVVAISVAVALAFSGAYIAAGIAGLAGVVLFVLYERYGIDSISVSEEQVEEYSTLAADEVQEAVEKAQNESKK